MQARSVVNLMGRLTLGRLQGPITRLLTATDLKITNESISYFVKIHLCKSHGRENIGPGLEKSKNG